MDQRRIPAWLTILVIYTRYIFIVLYPIILSPVLILYPGTEAKAAYILLLMSGFWITGFIPLYVTALFPLILAPLMGLAPSAVIAKEYSSSSNFLFLGGMILAIAAENVNLHRRIAVAFVRWMGHDARFTDSKGRKRLRNFATGISLSVCYAASCGGIATLIGSPPNIIFYGLAVRSKNDEADKFYTDDDARVQSMDNLEERERSTDQEENDEISSDIVKIVKKVSEEEQRALGPMKFGEIACMILLLLLIALWVTREPGVPGWSRFMPTSNDSTGKIVRYVDDTQSTLLFAILAFIIPASNPFRLRADPNETSKQARKRINRGILTWDLAQSRTSWGVLILMGGGFALSKIATVGGLSKLISRALEVVRPVHPFGLVFLITLVGATLTEVVSNAATVTILVPIMFDLNELKGAYLLLLMSGYWITGFIPLYVTALLPVLYAPLMGLVTSTAISRAYMSSSNLLFLCCMILAVATENTNLHRRIAMAFVRKMGNDENEDLVLRENTGSQSSIPLDKAPVKSNQLKEIKRFSTGISLSIAYAASCGGIATITGTATNTIFYGLISSRYGDSTPLNFGSWMAFAFPISLLCLLAVWIVICLVYLGPRAFFNCAAKKPKEIDPNKDATEASQAFLAAGGTVSTNPEHGKEEEEEKRDASVNITSAVQKISREESLALGSIKFGELSCLVIFALLIVLWIGREPGIPGWSRLMPTTKDANGRVMQYVDDVQATVFFVILVFLLPATNPLRVRLNEAEGGKVFIYLLLR
ncbi:unnamed protein product [Schistocephalus solidus]|uniref:Protein i m not dead yet n=1 Tax=Schistocephalus solidus TaxID=70667 RepID=A0A183SZ31_SCHSO|nr:unnamed protein product [Schistocephalus solidus]